MTQAAPGKSHRKGLTLVQIMRKFPDDATAEKWFAESRWPNGPHCPSCGSTNVQTGANHKTMPYRCRDCRKRFSVKTGSVMEASNLGYQTWAVAIYLALTSLKSVSSMKLHRDLGISQKSAWHLAHRIRTAFQNGGSLFGGPVEVDETYFGGKRKNMSNAKRRQLAKEGAGRGSVGKVAVVGAKDRATKQVRAKVVQETDRATLHGFVTETAAPGAKVYTDEAVAYQGMPFDHETVKHSVSEYVRGMAHTNGAESLWSMLKRSHTGTFHKISPKHLQLYVDEFAGRHNVRELDTSEQMAGIAAGMVGKRLRYADLIADNGLDSGARSS